MRLRSLSCFVALATFAALSCGGDEADAPSQTAAGSSAAGTSGTSGQSGTTSAGQGGAGAGGEAGSGQGGEGQGGAGQGGEAGSGGTGEDFSKYCADQEFPVRPFSAGPYGTRRGQIAEDFQLPLMDGTSWSFQASYSGCESYLFLPDTLTVSQQDSSSIWKADLPALLKLSPKNAHYFFVSRASAASAEQNTAAMQQRVEETLAGLGASLAEHWKKRLHVVKGRAADLGNWVGDALMGHGAMGLAIDRTQRVRGVGSFADVKRSNPDLQAANLWPWEANLAYAGYEAQYFNAQVDQQDKLDAEKATVVELFGGEILEQFAEKDVTLPSAEEMAGFDTMQIEISMACPDPDKIEFGNCGAWDYIATLGVDDGKGKLQELARFITSYHRETHWVVDASPVLALLKQGGSRHFRWDFAPEWNKQPTATRLSLRLSNRAKGLSPAEATPLFSGGPFDAAYNTSRPPVAVPIPADAKKVEVYVLVTGHGATTYQCAEFCAHEHEVSVNGVTYKKKFTGAGSSEGCIAQVKKGMVPNQGGTWWFGRGGWCPGQQVEPWVLDVTADVTPGQDATIGYRGLFGGSDPTEQLGDIVLSSYLVVSR